MDPELLNAVICEDVSAESPYILTAPRRSWSEPPYSIGVWVEIENLSEKEFSVGIEIWRGKQMVDHMADELVLPGQSYWQSRFEMELPRSILPKSHAIRVLLNGAIARILKVNFGIPE